MGEGTKGRRPTNSAAPRVAFISQWFPPEPAPIALGITRSLRARGLDVEVLTGIPNYPAGRVYDDYSAVRRRVERRDGLRVVRTPLYPSHDRRALGRAANYLSWAGSSAALGASVLRAADVSLVYGSPITTAVPAITTRLRRRTPYVLMVMDLWPDSVFATGFLTERTTRRVAEAALTAFTERVYRWADHITVPAPGLRETIIDRGVCPDKVSVVYNWTDEKVMQPADADPRFRARLGLTSDDFVLMYAGNHGLAQRLDAVMDAMARLVDLPDVHLVLIGDGLEKQELRTRARHLRLDRVHFLDPVQPEALPMIMAAADLHLVSLAAEPLFRITLPSKVQALLACGLPMLVCAPGDAARIVTAAGAGFAAPPEDPVGLAEVIRQARALPRAQLRAMGRSGHEHYHTYMSEDVNAKILADVLTAAARSGGPRRQLSGGCPPSHGVDAQWRG
ncbi:glycosyltransferase WbuB [Micromonospora sonchi]|uniref:Glycosyltransferase WbuB n=1 Tax=Micromonospora sonchi TaxID=1763543 RepID=A0A917WYK4_9ACTN|nr:glycosyltransferase family 4 protein [Micromonospora sonchi]GGM45931.1 glycosyltransferase WbuB [Micromonospora sonchi]